MYSQYRHNLGVSYLELSESADSVEELGLAITLDKVITEPSEAVDVEKLVISEGAVVIVRPSEVSVTETGCENVDSALPIYALTSAEGNTYHLNSILT